jgi:hypothetical protein
MPSAITLINSITVGSGGAASMEFTSIPSTYTDLVVLLTGRTTSTFGTDVSGYCHLEINSNITNGSARAVFGTGSTAGSFAVSNPPYVGYVSTSASTASTFGNMSIYFTNYAGGNNKSWSADAVAENNGTVAVSSLIAGLWSSTSAITAVKVYPNSAYGNFAQYSTAYLYGISNA